ncbi:MAG TPA: hypothetical protein IAB04_06515 [Candidatus Avimonoglobus intestinipullorum]|uniref:Uncharacterized protein n=1 Tax=Candidatus Avimonoglobus intestinipullorum TaxID=2840699 RepID=A0A9D1LVR6_9FIRM|nr:hypothetical protein [Candidatus Avimonoglobus intestinipullorum]
MVLTREYIEEAFRTPVRRERLKYVLGCGSDREARRIVTKLQEQGYNIINLQDGGGYVLGTDEQREAYGQQELHRAMKILFKALKMLRRLTLREAIRLLARAYRRAADTTDQNQISLEDVS